VSGESEDRLERLEKRMAALEEEIGSLRRAILIRLGGLTPAEAARAEEAAASSAAAGPPAPPMSGPPSPQANASAPEATSAPEAATAPEVAPSPATDAPERESSGPRDDIEQWLGQRGLLVVGLLALVVSAAFLLEYAFERGWISPRLRIGAGLAVGGLLWWQGERLVDRGMRHFGAALVGGGGAVAYLALWAAAGPHRILPPWTGIVLLGLLGMVVLLRAARLDGHLLAALACAGAYLAPVLLPDAAGSSDLLVPYVGFVALGCGAVAAQRGWRGAFAVAVIGAYALVGGFALGTARAWLLGLALAGGGALAAMAAYVRGWRVLRGIAVAVSWGFLFAVGVRVSGTGAAWGVYAFLPLLALPSWRRGLGPLAGRSTGAPSESGRSGEWPWLVLGGLGWALAARAAAPAGIASHPVLVLGIPALPYLTAAVTRRSVPAHVVGMAIAAWAAASELTGLPVTVALGLLALASAWLARPRSLAAARWTALALEAVAALRLLSDDLYRRGAGDPVMAVTGPWARTLYFLIASLVLLGGALAGAPAPGADRAGPGARWPRLLRASGRAPAGLRSSLLAFALLLALTGGTVEVLRLFPPTGHRLARELTVSVFWLLFAGALLAWGFWRDRRTIRIAGLAVSGLALIKVVLHDLTALHALYRVGSFFILALIALGAAFAYHRRVGGDGGAADPPGRSLR